jgi:phosphohistidine phosphatase
MMELYILRHTSAADPHSYAQDADRPLTESGLHEAKVVAKAMKALKIEPALTLCSPYRRTRETAGAITSKLALDPPEDFGYLLPGADAQALLSDLERRRVKSALLVGHSPDLPELIGLLCSHDGSLLVEFSKGALAIISAERPLRRKCGYLQAILPVKVCEKIG